MIIWSINIKNNNYYDDYISISTHSNVLFIISTCYIYLIFHYKCPISLKLMDSDWLSGCQWFYHFFSAEQKKFWKCHCRCSCGVAFFISIELEWLLNLYSYHTWCERAFKKKIEQLKKKKHYSYENTSMLSKLNI